MLTSFSRLGEVIYWLGTKAILIIIIDSIPDGVVRAHYLQVALDHWPTWWAWQHVCYSFLVGSPNYVPRQVCSRQDKCNYSTLEEVHIVECRVQGSQCKKFLRSMVLAVIYYNHYNSSRQGRIIAHRNFFASFRHTRPVVYIVVIKTAYYYWLLLTIVESQGKLNPKCHLRKWFYIRIFSAINNRTSSKDLQFSISHYFQTLCLRLWKNFYSNQNWKTNSWWFSKQ